MAERLCVGDAVYRYVLSERWDDRPLLNFVLLNPSTASATVVDPTWTRCRTRAQQAGSYGGVVITNLFALRSTDPGGLRWVDDPIGPENDGHLVSVALAATVVLGWGKHGSYRDRYLHVFRLLRQAGVKLYCLGRNQDGSPRHPLYVPYATVPMLW